MESQEILNKIATLGALIDPMTRAGNADAAQKVIEKINDLVAKL